MDATSDPLLPLNPAFWRPVTGLVARKRVANDGSEQQAAEGDREYTRPVMQTEVASRRWIAGIENRQNRKQVGGDAKPAGGVCTDSPQSPEDRPDETINGPAREPGEPRDDENPNGIKEASGAAPEENDGDDWQRNQSSPAITA
jgi:hypothetical protein